MFLGKFFNLQFLIEEGEKVSMEKPLYDDDGKGLVYIASVGHQNLLKAIRSWRDDHPSRFDHIMAVVPGNDSSHRPGMLEIVSVTIFYQAID